MDISKISIGENPPFDVNVIIEVPVGADPVKYDFALCHLGVSRDCPSRRDPLKCDACVLRTVCRQWRR